VNSFDPSGRFAQMAADGCNITITIPITYYGPGATPSVIEKFNRAIESHWTGQFGQYNVTTPVVAGNQNRICVPNGSARAYVLGVGGNTGVWPAEVDDWVAAHEAGHWVGIPEFCDDSNPNDPNPNESIGLPGYEGTLMGEYGGAATEEYIAISIHANMLSWRNGSVGDCQDGSRETADSFTSRIVEGDPPRWDVTTHRGALPHPR